MATISTPGVGSGLDVNSIVTQLVALEKQPLTVLQTKASSLQTKLSAYGTIKSQMSSLQDASAALLNSSSWATKTFSSNNSSAITGTATEGALATSFSVKVVDLAQAQSVRAGAVTTGATMGSDGSLSIQLGEWAGSSFTEGSISAVSVSITSTDTMTDIAGKINQAGAGVTALVVRSGTEERLMIRGNSTGSESGFRIQTFDGSNAAITDGTTGVGKLAYDTNGVSVYGMTQTQSALNSNVEIDGISVSSATNTVSDAVPGVTLNLLATTSTATQVTVGADTTVAKSKIEAFQKAYNTLNATLASMTSYNAESKSAGTLQGDSTAVGLQNVLRSMLGANGPSGSSFGRLSDVGLELQRDGSLSLNATKMTSSLSNLTNLQSFFDTDSGSSATDGMARRLRDFVRTAVSIDGNIDNRNKALKSAIDRNGDEQDTVSARITRTEARLYAQYSRLDASMAALSSLSSFVTAQVAVWNQSS